VTWYDTRTKKPPSHSYKVYVVVFQSYKFSGNKIVGLCGYMPNSNYTDGEWQNPMATNLNEVGGEVLYWSEYPTLPKDVL
jgi:hypothetical protein